MDNIDIISLLPVLLIGFAVLVVVLIILKNIMVNVGAREIAIKERRYLGAKMPPGRVVATEGEVGIQADVLKPGLHLIKFPFEKVVRKVPLIEIGPDELGVVEAIDGSSIAMRIDTICVHSDTPGAVELAAAVRTALSGAHVEVRAFTTG